MSSSRYASPVTGLLTIWRACRGTRRATSAISPDQLDIRANRVQTVEEHLEVDLDDDARGSTRMSLTRPTGTPRYRTGLETSRPLTFSVV